MPHTLGPPCLSTIVGRTRTTNTTRKKNYEDRNPNTEAGASGAPAYLTGSVVGRFAATHRHPRTDIDLSPRLRRGGITGSVDWGRRLFVWVACFAHSLFSIFRP